MMMNLILPLKVSAVACLIFAGATHAAVVADFTEDFSASEPTKGWSYQWNPEGVALGQHGRYEALSQYKRSGKLVVSSSPQFSKENPYPNAEWLKISSGFVTPGDPVRISTDGLDHYVIMAYEIQPGEAGIGTITNSRITMSAIKTKAKSLVAATISLYINDQMIGSGTIQADEDSRFNVPLGKLDVGDIIYVAIGPGDSRATGLSIQFQISTE